MSDILIHCQNEECRAPFRIEVNRGLPTLSLCALCCMAIYIERLASFALSREAPKPYDDGYGT
jgi:hypothetical protein